MAIILACSVLTHLWVNLTRWINGSLDGISNNFTRDFPELIAKYNLSSNLLYSRVNSK